MTSRSLALSLAVYAASAGVVLAASLAMTRGELVLPLDDAYIHFAIARTLADHHAYGLQPGAFSTPASSLLWPLLLALARIAHAPLDLTALAIGFAAGAISLVVIDDVLVREGVGPRARTVLLLTIGALVPLVPMALLGMEHSLQVAVVLALVTEGSRTEAWTRRRVVVLFVLAFLAVSLRYESAFVVAALAAWLAALAPRSNRRPIAALALGGVLPVTLAAAFFGAHGAPPFPLSVLLKRTHATLGSFPELLLHRFVEHPHVPGLFVALILAWLLSTRESPARAWLFVGAAALFAHTTVAQIGWLYRYESHAIAVSLVGLALTVALPRARERASGRLARTVAVCGGMAMIPVGVRAALAHAALPQASRNVAEQQVAIGRFVRALSPRDPVAVNDVGAIAYVGEARVLDLLGLADLRVARARGMRIDAPLSRAEVDRFTRDEHVSLAVLYESWFQGAIPASWVALERWRIHDNRVCAFDTVTFFATRPDAVLELRSALEAYRTQVPARVQVMPEPP